MKHSNLYCAVAVLTIVGIQPAFAYLDPGTGSILIQSLIAALAAGAYAIKMYWYRIKGFFSRSADQDNQNTDIESREESEKPVPDAAGSPPRILSGS